MTAAGVPSDPDPGGDGASGVSSVGEPAGGALPGPGPSNRFTWNPAGDDLDKALIARAKAAGRGGRRPNRRTRERLGRRDRHAPGAGWSGPAGDDRDPQLVGTAVDRLVGEHGWDDNLAVHGVIARWDQVVGAEVAEHVRPEQYHDGILTVRAVSTAWATQVRLLAADMVRKLNREIGDGSVIRLDVLGPQAPSWRKGRRSVKGRGPRDTYG